eukprot:gene11545-12739_t
MHGMERSCQNAPFIGFYDPDYWVLSETQQIKNGQLPREDECEYIIMNNNVKAMSFAVNKNLIGSFSNFLQRADAGRYGIHPDTALKKNNVGKSKCLEILASGIGAPDNYCHPMFLSGGDSVQSGTTPIDGRTLTFYFKWDASFAQSEEDILKMELQPTRDELPNTTQRRWTSGMSSTLATYCMVLTWLNPSTYFRASAKRKIKSIAIAVNVLNRSSNASHMADHVEFCYDAKFMERQGETWFRRKPGAEEKHFCDFQVKLLGSIAGDYEEKEGHWLAKITCKSGGRTTALPASFLDSRTKFETTIRKKFGHGPSMWLVKLRPQIFLNICGI